MAPSKDSKIDFTFKVEARSRKRKIKKSFRQHVYVLTDPSFPTDVRYVGRTNNPTTRLSMHATTFADQSARGAWLVHLNAASIRPVLTIVEQAEFSDAAESERWASAQEATWLKHYINTGTDLLNAPHFWERDDRKNIENGVRAAWFRMLQVISRALFPSTRWQFEQLGNRYAMAEGIKGLVSVYPGLYVAPLEYLSRATPMSGDEMEQLRSKIDELSLRVGKVTESAANEYLKSQIARLTEIAKVAGAASRPEVNALVDDINLILGDYEL